MPTLRLPIETERLRLRPMTPDDLDDVDAYQSMEEVARHLYRRPRTRAESAALLAAAPSRPEWTADGDRLILAVCRPTSRTVLGEVSLTLASAHARQFEIGWILNPRYEGQGYATEAARALAVAAFDELGAHRLFARLDADNTGSVRLCKRLGMRREAHLVENDRHPDGRWGSEYVYAALERDLRR